MEKVITKRCSNNHMAAPDKVARQQTTQCNSPEPSEPCLRYLHHFTTPQLSGIFRNLPPEPAIIAHTGTLQNLPETPELSVTFRNLPPETTPSGTYTSTRRNSPEPSGNCLQNLHQHTPEPTPAHAGIQPSGTCLAHAGTLRNLPEPASGT